MNKNKIIVKRYNIYSCLTLKLDKIEVCFDPAKIPDNIIPNIDPDLILISHESMDHMDPIQVYKLQKKKNCEIFCSLAAAIDLRQYFPLDTDFIDKINILTPKSKLKTSLNIVIETEKSIHCDYMLPLVFKIHFLKENISILHCFDSHISDEIIQFSENTDICIIPVGIAKGINPLYAIDFATKLKNKYFITNHFKDERQLNEFNSMLKEEKKTKFLLLDWNKEGYLMVDSTKNSFFEEEKVVDFSSSISLDFLKAFIKSLNKEGCKLLQNKDVLIKLFDQYKSLTDEQKSLLVVIYTMITLIDSNFIPPRSIEALKEALLSKLDNTNNSLQVTILCFLGVHSQQSGISYFLDDIKPLITSNHHHLNYWILEYLGRTITSKCSNYKRALSLFHEMLKNQDIYNSVVERRKIFWELFRIMKYLPHISKKFFKIFEDGLVDSNPDVRLLAILCFAQANRVEKLTDKQLKQIFSLLKDEEDDVRETAAIVIAKVFDDYSAFIKLHLSALEVLLDDCNYHVKIAAQKAEQIIQKGK